MSDPDLERRRLAEDPATWQQWGPYLSERAWGTVREDYSADGDAWNFFPHDHARSRAYRWSEDGLGGICDSDQRLCLAFAFWNGVDPILKERAFGLTGEQGNHGEDVKELYWYLDCTPTHSWMRWRYVYPQRAFPYDALVHHGRDRTQPELELMDTGVLDEDRYWDVTVDYAKAGPQDICLRVRVRNAGPDAETLHLLPTLWWRNRWSWGDPEVTAPRIYERDGALHASDGDAITMALTGDGEATPLFCENATNVARLWPDSPAATPPFPKDGIGDHVISGAATVDPDASGTKAALWYRLAVDPGDTVEVRLRLAPQPGELGDGHAAVLGERAQEADVFYAGFAPGASDDEHAVLRQAFAGMLWSKQYYHYDVTRWLDGDPGQPPPPPQRAAPGARNVQWRHVDCKDIISMPDAWEYPWFAAWDLAFHTITLAHVDPAFAKSQLRLLTREWYQHPDGQLPAYEWNFGDVNPPVHAVACLSVYEIDGARDREWLEREFHKLMLCIGWWTNVKSADGEGLFGGGFLGMDNIGPFDRSEALAPGCVLEQADGTSWMGLFCLAMLEMALELAAEDPAYEDVAITFFENFTRIAAAINRRGLWSEDDGFYYDRLRHADGSSQAIRVRSMSGLIPLCAVATADPARTARLPEFTARVQAFVARNPQYAESVQLGDDRQQTMLALVGRNRLERMLDHLLDPDQFLSGHGIRSVSAAYRGAPYTFTDGEGGPVSSIDYEPAESTTPMFGGNSNWRGPIWFPVNFLIIRALRRYAVGLGGGLAVADPTGSDEQRDLDGVADDLARRLIGIFLPDPALDGRRPVFENRSRFRDDPAFTGDLLFHEYFHGDTGAGLGASHQTGWTGLVADLLIGLAARRGDDVG